MSIREYIEDYAPVIILFFIAFILVVGFSIAIYHDAKDTKREEEILNAKYNQEEIIVHRNGIWRIYRLKGTKTDTNTAKEIVEKISKEEDK